MAFLIAVICKDAGCGRPFAKGPFTGEPKRTTVAALTCPSCGKQHDYDPADIVVSAADSAVPAR
jgi:hypothetical protein